MKGAVPREICGVWAVATSIACVQAGNTYRYGTSGFSCTGPMQTSYQAVAAGGDLLRREARGTAASNRRAAGLALTVMAVVGATAVVYAGVAGSAERAAVLSQAAGAATPAKPQQLAKLQAAHHRELVEEETLLKEDAVGLQDAARLKNAAWLAQQYDSSPEVKGLSGEQAEARKAKLILQNAVSVLEKLAAQEQNKAEKLKMNPGQALQEGDPIFFNDPFMDNGGFFKVCGEGCTHGEAHQACIAAGAELASIHSADDTTEAAATCAGTDGVFVSEFFDFNHDLGVIPDLTYLTPSRTRTTSTLNYNDQDFLNAGCPHDRFAARFTGEISIEQGGHYTFETTSDDGSKLWVGGTLVVNNDGLHGPAKRSGPIHLQPGYYPITVTFFENWGGAYLDVEYSGPDTGDVDANLTVTICPCHVC